MEKKDKPYDFTFARNLKSKTNEQAKQNVSRLTDTGNSCWLPEWGAGRRMSKTGEGD